ncbi:MAG: hypothetical protein KJZ78_12570, partial [Bryobacteraceae bacterium]|nr:hypothetical protein [Bryobacteraceae bacterium]
PLISGRDATTIPSTQLPTGPQFRATGLAPKHVGTQSISMPDKVKELSALLEKVKASPRSRVDVRTPVDNN